jgi:hypothetical protein
MNPDVKTEIWNKLDDDHPVLEYGRIVACVVGTDNRQFVSLMFSVFHRELRPRCAQRLAGNALHENHGMTAFLPGLDNGGYFQSREVRTSILENQV